MEAIATRQSAAKRKDFGGEWKKAKSGGDIFLNGFDISLTEIRKLF